MYLTQAQLDASLVQVNEVFAELQRQIDVLTAQVEKLSPKAKK